MADIESLQERYAAIYGREPCAAAELALIESLLGVHLPDDFKAIATFYRGGALGGLSHHAIASGGPASNIVEETLRIRSAINLNKRYVVLAEPAESLIVLDLLQEPAVIWCDAVEAPTLNTQNFIGQPDVWQTYKDFFAYLIKEEEVDGE